MKHRDNFTFTYTRGRQNNGNTKKMKYRICVGCIERTSVGNTECLFTLCSAPVCMYKGWAIKLALAPRPFMIYCASTLTTAMIITVAALRIVFAHGSKPT
jgi:hypothetical protein